ncbi:MAG TPA: hypothetical protein VE983_07545 [Solirubrobacteraceae bacterium]|nr:hypothetical protein [Solirubrobacteraceae bacterium]
MSALGGRWALISARYGDRLPPESLGVLLLPSALEEFELAEHARDLLSIPRVVAVEPPRWRRRALLGDDMQALRHVRRLRFPGQPRVIVLYDPRQYHLARALCVTHQAELWYSRGHSLPATASMSEAEDMVMLDQFASELASGTLSPGRGEDPRGDNEPLRRRLVELDVINARPFVPERRVGRR